MLMKYKGESVMEEWCSASLHLFTFFFFFSLLFLVFRNQKLFQSINWYLIWRFLPPPVSSTKLLKLFQNWKIRQFVYRGRCCTVVQLISHNLKPSSIGTYFNKAKFCHFLISRTQWPAVTHFMPLVSFFTSWKHKKFCSLSIPPESIRKLLLFWCFQRV